MEDLDIHYTYVIRMKVSKKIKYGSRDYSALASSPDYRTLFNIVVLYSC